MGSGAVSISNAGIQFNEAVNNYKILSLKREQEIDIDDRIGEKHAKCQ